jgi:hypothetical protein
VLPFPFPFELAHCWVFHCAGATAAHGSSSIYTEVCTACTLAQGPGCAGAGKLWRPAAGAARLPWALVHGWHSALWQAMAEGVTCLTDFLGSPWRPHEMAPDADHVSCWPSRSVGTARTALYQEVRGLHACMMPPKHCLGKKGPGMLCVGGSWCASVSGDRRTRGATSLAQS